MEWCRLYGEQYRYLLNSLGETEKASNDEEKSDKAAHQIIET